MHSFKKEYNCQAEAIITEAVVLPVVEIRPGMAVPPHFYTDNAAWDTGAQFTFVSPRVVESLHLQPYSKGQFMGIGGDQESYTYKLSVALPNGRIIQNLEVYCTDIDDYDLLLGMDIISQTDFLITNKDNKTIFQFRSPSQGGIQL